MAQLKDHLFHALRRLARAPLFTAITLITLAVGIGANTVVFSVVEGVLLKPLDYPHSERLIGIWHSAPGIGFDRPEYGAVPLLHRPRTEHDLEDVGMYNGDSLSRHRRRASLSTSRAWTSPTARCRCSASSPSSGRLFTRRDDTARRSQDHHPLLWLLAEANSAADTVGRSAAPSPLTARRAKSSAYSPETSGSSTTTSRDRFCPCSWIAARSNSATSASADRAPQARRDPQAGQRRYGAPASHRRPQFPRPRGFSPAIFEQAKIDARPPHP